MPATSEPSVAAPVTFRLAAVVAPSEVVPATSEPSVAAPVTPSVPPTAPLPVTLNDAPWAVAVVLFCT